MAYNPTSIEKKWQSYWLTNKTFRALDPHEAGDKPKKYILDMFPYPSGAGLHVGHPEGYTATDIVSRYYRHKGFNVLHPMGWDAFGLPAEQYAVKTNTHPRLTTQQNISKFRQQIQMLGLSYDWDREIDTTDPKYYRWTQWIFLKLYESYFDPFENAARPISHLIRQLENENLVVAPDGSIHINPVQEGMEAVTGDVNAYRKWSSFEPGEQRGILDGQRLAYTDEVPVNWCPALGTVLANEEVIDGKSEVGGYPVERRPMRQWMLRITAYAERLLQDLEHLDWPESLKEMQRNWIGRSVGAEVDFAVDGIEELITVFTTRPDTLFGATYMVLAPEHDLVDRITTTSQRSEVEAYRTAARNKSERDRLAHTKDKTGVWTGAYAINPVNDQKIPIWIADYVLMGYGTGAIMAVPAHDDRDFDFARKFGLPIKPVVAPEQAPQSVDTMDQAFIEKGIAINSSFLDGLPTDQAKERMIEYLESENLGRRSIQYKLRDWLFSRQRYWGEPFPIVLDNANNHYPVPESELPVTLPEMQDFKPTGTPEPPLSKAKEWTKYHSSDPRLSTRTLTRETNTMPQWAGSCWYYLRYLDPTNDQAMVDPDKEKYWMPVDLYVGGVEHAVLHLLYARFWHKVLFDLGYVSTPEPFQKLVNQGLILGETEYHFFEDENGKPVSATEMVNITEEATEQGPRLVGTHKRTGRKYYATRVVEPLVEKRSDRYVLKADPSIVVDARSFKMSKSRGNVVNPDDIVRDYGADCFRLYEMYMGPLEAQKPWNTRDIVGMWRFLNGVWRNLVGEEDKPVRLVDGLIPDELDRLLHRTIKKVGDDIENLRFNTAIAELIKLNNEIGRLEAVPRRLAETFAVLLSPFAPHLAEELWEKLGKPPSIQHQPWPSVDPEKLVESRIELPVQINGKLRDKLLIDTQADEQRIFELVESSEKIKPWLAGKTIRKKVYVPKKMVNYVVS
ncbi:MAG: leucine--tRNA ligase [Phycisphaerae bacterium]|jgi:leucyl-tRNA synthetase|nr:MAG: leucine--tRNA ligase [Phycisphaerae bacterium]